MEDQQPAAGGLSAEVAEESVETEAVRADSAESDETVKSDEALASDEDAEDGGDADTAEADATVEAEASDATVEAEATPAATADKKQKKPKAPKAKKSKKPKKPKDSEKSRRRLAVAVAALVCALFVGSAAFAGAAVQPLLAERATIEIKEKVARAAVNAVTALFSYNPENMDGLNDRAGKYLTGDFRAQYRKFLEPIVSPSKQAKLTNSTEVTGAAVESLNDPNAVVIVYTNTTTTSPLKKNIPTMQYLSYGLYMKREGNNWLVTRMTTITSLDVTPKL